MNIDATCPACLRPRLTHFLYQDARCPVVVFPKGSGLPPTGPEVVTDPTRPSDGDAVADILITQVPACDRCAAGVMDATNPHLLATCRCTCHLPPAGPELEKAIEALRAEWRHVDEWNDLLPALAVVLQAARLEGEDRWRRAVAAAAVNGWIYDDRRTLEGRVGPDAMDEARRRRP